MSESSPDKLRMLVAPLWRIWIAKVFGKKHVEQEGGYTVTFYSLRGNFYIWSVE